MQQSTSSVLSSTMHALDPESFARAQRAEKDAVMETTQSDPVQALLNASAATSSPFVSSLDIYARSVADSDRLFLRARAPRGREKQQDANAQKAATFASIMRDRLDATYRYAAETDAMRIERESIVRRTEANVTRSPYACDGWRRWNAITDSVRAWAERGKINIPAYQMHFVYMGLLSRAVSIFGDDWKEQERNFLHLMNISFVPRFVFADWKRRFGKTQGSSYKEAIYIWFVEGETVIIFAQNQEVAEEYIRKVVKILRKCVDPKVLEQRIVYLSKYQIALCPESLVGKGESLSYRRNHPGVTRLVACSADDASASNGLNPTKINIDEAKSIKEEFYDNNIWGAFANLHGMAITVTSSPGDEDTHYAKMVTQTDDDGKSVYTVLRVASVCESCGAKGESRCKHATSPPWIEAELYKSSEKMMSAGAIQTEILAEIRLNGVRALHPQDVTAFLNSTPVAIPRRVDVAFVTVDPSQGSSVKSNLAASLGFFAQKDQHLCAVIAGLADINIRLDNGPALRSFMAAIRKHEAFRYSLIVFVPEANPSTASYQLAELATREFSDACAECEYGPMYVVKETHGGEEIPGMHTDNDTKCAWYERMHEALSKHRLARSVPTIVPVESKADASMLWETWKTQAEALRIIATTSGKRWTISGKGKFKTKPDDLVIATCLLVRVMFLLAEDATFSQYREHLGLSLFS